MDTASHSLWQRIDRFQIDRPDATLTFTARLARDNGWSRDYARRVVDEYKRFMFLTTVADHVVTPSEAVDQAWHLHLTYTRSYWGEFCGEVLGRKVHHDPTTGQIILARRLFSLGRGGRDRDRGLSRYTE